MAFVYAIIIVGLTFSRVFYEFAVLSASPYDKVIMKNIDTESPDFIFNSLI